jgi:hypothetical protein
MIVRSPSSSFARSANLRIDRVALDLPVVGVDVLLDLLGDTVRPGGTRGIRGGSPAVISTRTPPPARAETCR